MNKYITHTIKKFLINNDKNSVKLFGDDKQNFSYFSDYEDVLYHACYYNYTNFIYYLMSKTHFSIDRCICQSALGGHLELVKFFLDTGDKIINLPEYGMSKQGHYYTQYSYGLMDYSEILNAAAEGGNMNVINFLIKTWVNEIPLIDWNMPLQGASKNGNLSLVQNFIQLGATRFDWALISAIEGNNFNVVKFFIEHRLIDRMRESIGYALLASVNQNNKEILEYLIDFANNNSLHINYSLLIHEGRRNKEIKKFLKNKMKY